MPKVSPIQNDFSAGEISPTLIGRTDVERVRTALTTCLNYIPTLQGGLGRRTGTTFVAEVKDSDSKARLQDFEFSITQAYVLEFGHEYIRFFKDRAQIEVDDDPYEIESPYQEDEVFDLRFNQSADVLYITHPNHPPRKLNRFGHDDWDLQTIKFVDGPYGPTNSTAATLVPSSATGSGVTLTTGPSRTITGAIDNGDGRIRITAVGHGYESNDQVLIASVVGTTEANGTWTVNVIDDDNFVLRNSVFSNAYVSGGTSVPALFASTDVGRLIRIKEGSVWGRVIVTAYTSPASVTVTVQATLTNTSAKTTWRLGTYSETTGYPAVSVFHEDRLFFAGSPDAPQKIDGSQTGDYENFAPTATDGTVVASNAVSFTLNANDVNVIRWLVSDEKGLLAGTVANEWVIRSSSSSEAISPTSITAKQSTSLGSANIAPIQAGKSALYVQRAGRKLRELTYFYDAEGFRSTDLSRISEHITETGLVQLAFQKEPQPIVWCVRNDGILIGVTYDRESDNVTVGWHRHQLGGTIDAAGNHAVVESVSVIPAPDGKSEDLWLIVRRTIDGSTKRYIEVFAKKFDDETDQKDAFFLDSGLSYDEQITMQGASTTNPVSVGAIAHGLANGQKIRIDEVEGMTELNGKTFTVSNATADTFELSGIDGSSYSVFVSGGKVRKLVTTITGLEHLEGEEVSILGDGAVQPNQTVSGGSVTLQNAAGIVHVGLSYISDAQMLRIDAGAADGTAMGKTRRIHRVGFLLHRSLNLLMGPSFDDLNRIVFRKTSDPLSQAPSLFTGIISENFDGGYDFDNQIAWRQDQPLPSTILAVFPQMVTQDR